MITVCSDHIAGKFGGEFNTSQQILSVLHRNSDDFACRPTYFKNMAKNSLYACRLPDNHPEGHVQITS